MRIVHDSNFPALHAQQISAFLRRVSVLVIPTDLPTDLCRDPADLPVLGTAIASECSLLISVDKDLLDLRDIQDIPIIRPGDYWRRAAAVE